MSAYRTAVVHLDDRLGDDDHDVAAFGGLQDSAPRAGLLALHARMEGVGPGSWQDQRLVQVWFRWADHLVPRRDVGLFTLGCSPRDRERRAALDRLAHAVTAALDGRALTYEQLLDACPALEDRLALRALAVTGKVHIRWDARVLRVLPADPAEIDEEDARRQLLRRFLQWLGPSSPAGFARWAGVSRTDVALTWDALRSGLVAVSVSGKPGWVLAEDEAAFAHHGSRTEGQVRFLPPGDPYLYPTAAQGPRRPPSRDGTQPPGRADPAIGEQPHRPTPPRRSHRRVLGPGRRQADARSLAVANRGRATSSSPRSDCWNRL